MRVPPHLRARCEVEGCAGATRNVRTGVCEMHFQRMKKHGTYEPTASSIVPLEDRFARYATRGEGCWIWTGPVDSKGYGRLLVGGRGGTAIGAHRIAYELHIGPIPDGLDLDHLCRTPLCVNPAHLEPVTRGENTRRGVALQRRSDKAAARTECGKGHEFTPENTYRDPKGHRRCRACERTNGAAHKLRMKERLNVA